jgi:hypothetical protein
MASTHRLRIALAVAMLLMGLAPSLVGAETDRSGAVSTAHAAFTAHDLQPTTVTCAWHTKSTPYKWMTDTNANYWVALGLAEPGATLAISGTYPSARFVSIEADAVPSGAFIAGLADKDFPPQAGSVNPFALGTPRGVGAYTVTVAFTATPPSPAPGTIYVNLPAGTTFSLVYRIYLVDTGATVEGNVPLPTITALGYGGVVPPGCTAMATPATPAKIAAPDIAWSAPLTPSLPPFHRVDGNIFSNVFSANLATNLPPPSLYVIRFKAPTTSHTLSGGPIDLSAQLRYWSLCLYFRDGYDYSCVADEQAVTSTRGVVTFVIGLWYEQPTNATASNGVTWIGLPVFSTPYFVLIRQILAAPTFTQSAFAVPPGAPAYPTMGLYSPLVVACDTAQFEANECPESAASKG